MLPFLSNVYSHSISNTKRWILGSNFQIFVLFSYANKNKYPEYVWRVEAHPSESVNIPLSYKKPKHAKKPAISAAETPKAAQTPAEAQMPTDASMNTPVISKKPKVAIGKKGRKNKKKLAVKGTKVWKIWFFIQQYLFKSLVS